MLACAVTFVRPHNFAAEGREHAFPFLHIPYRIPLLGMGEGGKVVSGPPENPQTIVNQDG
jgi:hypothetical protein